MPQDGRTSHKKKKKTYKKTHAKRVSESPRNSQALLNMFSKTPNLFFITLLCVFLNVILNYLKK